MVDFTPQNVPDTKAPPPLIPPSRPSRLGGVKEFYRANKWYVWAIVLGIIIIGALAVIAFRPQNAQPTKEANVEMVIDAPEVAPSGGEIIYRINIKNNDSSTLEGLELELVYDDGVSYISSVPKSESISGRSFKVPDMEPGQQASLIVKTSAQGSLNEDKELTAKLHYHFSNFTSEFVKEVRTSTRLVASDVTIEITGTQNTNNSQVVSYDVVYKNNSDKDIGSARVELKYPEGFVFSDSNPKPSLGQNIWNVASLKSGQQGKISFQGTFKNARPGQSLTFTADYLVLDDRGQYFIQASNTFITAVSSLPLVIDHKLESQAENNVVKPGDFLNYQVTYQNNDQTVATGVQLSITLDSKALDLASIRAQEGDVQGNEITWNASGVSNLERLAPNQSGQVRFSVRVKNPAVKDESTNIIIKSSARIKANEYQNYLPGNEITLKVSSPASMEGSASFVTGQLPPKVGQASTFQVILDLRNSTNEFRDTVVTGFVPNGVTFETNSVNSKEAGNVTYDPSTGKVTWKVGQLAAHLGDFNPVRKMTFNVRVTPTVQQVGQEAILFRNITLTAKDTFTDQTIGLKTDDIKTSDIPNGFIDGRVEN
jgi:hypothetical protein